MKPIIGAQLFTVRANTKTEEDIAETLRRVSEMGYRNVQISAFGPYRTAFLHEELEKNGLTVCATHTAYERIIGETDAVIAEQNAVLVALPIKEALAMQTKLSDGEIAAAKILTHA